MDKGHTQARALIFGAILCLAIFTGCGQKGPLFLPDEQAAEQVPGETGTAQEVADTVEQEEEDKQTESGQ